jgi:hypothetical protein
MSIFVLISTQKELTLRMPRTRKPSLFEQLTALAMELSKAVQKGETFADNTDGMLYSHSSTGVEDYFLRQAVAIIDTNLFTPLSAHGCKLLIRIISEMGMNNVFWRCDRTTANERRSIAELKRNHILFATERKGLYIINPFKLRRGKPMATIMSSISHFRVDNGVSTIVDLRPPGRALIQAGK